jgi:hypothetical protein
MKQLIRMKQVQVGQQFRWYGALYIKTREICKASHNNRDYGNNAKRVDNGKEVRIQGSYLVEVVE